MDNDDFVSVIIPVYNVEQYLPRCIESVMNQTHQRLEIILVDDGSTDKSGELCDAFSEKDKRIRVIHKPNGGLSDARNSGTALCKGKFVLYLDSDDYLEESAVSILMDAQKKYNADVVIGNYYYAYPDHEDAADSVINKTGVYSRKEAITFLMQGKWQTFAWGKLIRADIVVRHAFPVGKLFEDHFWTHLIFQDSEKIAYVPEPLVHYRQRANSISYTFNIERLDIIDGWKARIEFLQKEYPELVEGYIQRCAEDALNLAWCVLTRMKKGKKQGFLKIKEFLKEYQIENRCNGKTQKMICVLEKSVALYGLKAIEARIVGE